MRRLAAPLAIALALASLVALVPARPAGASGLLVQMRTDPSAPNDARDLWLQEATIRAILNNRRAPYTAVREGAVTTAGVKAGQLTTTLGVQQHDWFGLIGYTQAVTPSNTAQFDPRTYLRSATWPSKPGIWFLYPAPGCNTAGNNGSDTTGVNDCYPYSSATPNGSLYTVDGPYVWKARGSAIKPAVATTPRASGVWRAIIGYGDTPAGGGPNPYAVKDADSLARSANPDSVICWVRERSATDPAGQVFLYLASGLPDIASIKIALAELDRITARTVPGGAVFTNRPYTTRKHGLGVLGANRTGDPAGANLFNNGTYCPRADSCDYTNQARGRDSLIAWGVKTLTAFVDPESLTASPNAQGLAIWAAMPGAKFALNPTSGWSTTSTTRAGAAGRCIDPLGYARRRSLFPATGGSLTPNCATDSGSVVCNLAAGWAALESAVGADRIDHTLIPAAWDWSPQEWTRAGAGAISSSGGRLWGGYDSLAAALALGKVRTVLISPTAPNANAGISWANPDGFLTAPATTPAGLWPSPGRLAVTWGGRQLGNVTILGARWEPSTPSWTWMESTHDIGLEFLQGDELGKYFPVDAATYYRHTFNVGTRVLVVQAGNIGGPWGNSRPQLPAMRVIKWVQNGFSAANSRLPAWTDGTPKSLDEWAPIEEVTPE